MDADGMTRMEKGSDESSNHEAPHVGGELGFDEVRSPLENVTNASGKEHTNDLDISEAHNVPEEADADPSQPAVAPGAPSELWPDFPPPSPSPSPPPMSPSIGMNYYHCPDHGWYEGPPPCPYHIQ